MIEIYKDSEAYRTLQAMLADPDTYMIRIDDRTQSNFPGVALKQNEGMWTPALDCELASAPPLKEGPSFYKRENLLSARRDIREIRSNNV